MHYLDIEQINKDLSVTKKAIVGLGCSFVEGQGAVDQYLIENYKWAIKEAGVPMQPIVTDSEKNMILSRYNGLVSFTNDQWNWRLLERKNSFINILCEKYLEKKYTPINFGLRGKGNRASIKSLYFWPQINWDVIEELIIIYVPSGQERFDLIDDQFNNDSQFHCMWPNWKEQNSGSKRSLWKGYGEAVYSDKSAALEQISNIIELKNYCKLKNANLIITPAFDQHYNRSSMLGFLQKIVIRDVNQNILFTNDDPHKFRSNLKKHDYPVDYFENLEKIVDEWPWDKMFYPESCRTFVDLCLKQENLDGRDDPGFWDYIGSGTPDKWITVCCHPSAKAHDLFAMRLHEHIIKS
jgi:hypothetical protein